MIHYILQVLFFQLLFLLVYDLFLKKETFFNYNRLYLLATPILAFLIPWLRLEFLVSAVPENARMIIPAALTKEPDLYVQNLPLVIINAEGGWEPNWWLITYLSGALISLILFTYKYFHLKKLSSSGITEFDRELKIIRVPNSKIAYTFFNTIYLGNDLSADEKQQILSHEIVHVKQKHTYDLVFFEFLKIIFWFNPLIYIFQSRIAGVHEYIADNEVVKTISRKTYFEQLLNTAFNTKDISFTNQFFNHSLIKKRIIMLQKNKSSKLSKFKFLLVIPLMLAMLTYVSCSEELKEDEIDSSVSQYSYTLDKTEGMTAEKQKIHNKYEEFLFNHPDYVALATIDYNADKIRYSVQLRSEKIPEGYEKMEVSKKDGREYTMYMNLYSPEKDKAQNIAKPDNSMYDNKSKVPFALIDRVPAFQGCEEWEHDVRKNCTSGKISEFVSKNFDTSLGKKLGLTGLNRVIVQFRIDETGHIQDIKARAAKPELEEEAKRVVASIPQMQPGEQNGKPVSVMYSLPIAFKVAD
ncbi:M56 family metallopeptidase [Christiangramia echinicola]|uniref:M56 family metallopeptidase n=1 Tax=Christiangramia echinicola TaxID=279359 RepID=UPI0003F54DF2|nr:M56 family metallopeptidase [Christiangramia echinicola]